VTKMPSLLLYKLKKLFAEALYFLPSKVLTRPPSLQDIFRRWIRNDTRVLDIGCGTGPHEPFLRRLTESVVALDVSPCLVREVQRLCPTVSCTVGSAECLPYRDNAFDVSLLIVVLHHVADDRKALSEASRVSKVTIMWEQVYHESRLVRLLQKCQTAIMDRSKRYELARLKNLIRELNGEILEEYETRPIKNSYICVIRWRK